MFQTRSLAILLALFLGSLGASFLLFHPSIRELAQSVVFPSDREVLSLIRTEFYNMRFKILKIRSEKRIYLEIYEWNKGVYTLVDRAALTDSKDAFYIFQDKESNLFLKDIDNDNYPEIVVPSYDRNMIAHLNVFRYDVDNRRLIKLSDH